MKINSFYIAFLVAICTTVSAQTNHLKINPDIVMLKDSIESKSLLFSLNAFLNSAQKNGPNNKWILDAESDETYILIDEIQDIQKSEEFEDESFFKAYLTNLTPLEDQKYLVNIAYIGIKKDTSFLRANFELIAHKSGDTYLISSPFLRNTQNWKTNKIQNHIFHYPYTVDNELVQKYANHTIFCDKKLKNNIGESHYYLCPEEINPLKLIGAEYKSDYNSQHIYTSYTSQKEKRKLIVIKESMFYNFDLHDLWHNRLSQVIARKEVHRRVDCQIAYLYGGSWGISWEELFPLFREKFVVEKNIDWLEHKKNSAHFLTDGHKNYTDDFIGALIIKKVESEKGFEGVWELLMTKRTKEDEEYYTALNKLTGITKKSYNKEVSKLIEAEINHLQIN